MLLTTDKRDGLPTVNSCTGLVAVRLGCMLLSGCVLATCGQAWVWSQDNDRSTPTQSLVLQEVGKGSADEHSGEQKKRIAQLIEQLGDADYQNRLAAEMELTRIGLPAFEQLRRAHFHPNVQIDVAARYLLHSQRVTWWLETDPLSVRHLLEDYNESSPVERQTAIQRLGKEKSLEAMAALVRLARYENSETYSKLAALSLMRATLDGWDRQTKQAIVPKLRAWVSESDRTSCQWLLTLAECFEKDNGEAESWRKFSSAEHQLLQKKHGDTSNAVVFQLYRWIGDAFIERGERALALELVRPSLELTLARSFLDLKQTAVWAIDSRLPELVQELAQRHPAAFKNYAALSFLLAESYRKAGNEPLAQETAEATSQRVSDVGNGQRGDTLAVQRNENAKFLQSRGMYDWAEMEFEKALGYEINFDNETLLRVRIAEFYADGEDYGKAADCLQALLDKLPSRPEEVERLKRERNHFDAQNDLSGLNGTFHFYRGMSERKKGNRPAALEHLNKAALEYYENPDILIALHQVAEQGVSDQIYLEKSNALIAEYREDVLLREQELTEAGIEKSNIENMLATSCNQLAWLLAKTKQSPAEAIRLSQRSLELAPDYWVYLDTLARCYFSDGQLDLAITTQQQAVKLEPSQRSLKRQLEEFKAAKSAQSGR